MAFAKEITEVQMSLTTWGRCFYCTCPLITISRQTSGHCNFNQGQKGSGRSLCGCLGLFSSVALKFLGTQVSPQEPSENRDSGVLP
jgi:hypothetical protein